MAFGLRRAKSSSGLVSAATAMAIHLALALGEFLEFREREKEGVVGIVAGRENAGQFEWRAEDGHVAAGLPMIAARHGGSGDGFGGIVVRPAALGHVSRPD